MADPNITNVYGKGGALTSTLPMRGIDIGTPPNFYQNLYNLGRIFQLRPGAPRVAAPQQAQALRAAPEPQIQERPSPLSDAAVAKYMQDRAAIIQAQQATQAAPTYMTPGQVGNPAHREFDTFAMTPYQRQAFLPQNSQFVPTTGEKKQPEPSLWEARNQSYNPDVINFLMSQQGGGG